MNRIYIETNIVENTKSGCKSNEIKVYDDYGTGTFIVKSIPDDDLEILQLCKDIGSDSNKTICAVMDHILEINKGVHINNEFYKWEKIRHIFIYGPDQEVWDCLVCGTKFVAGEDGNELGLCEKCATEIYDCDTYYKDYEAGKVAFKGVDTLSRGILEPYKIGCFHKWNTMIEGDWICSVCGINKVK